MSEQSTRMYPAILQAGEEEQARWIRSILKDTLSNFRVGVQQHPESVQSSEQLYKEVSKVLEVWREFLELGILCEFETPQSSTGPRISKEHAETVDLLIQLDRLTHCACKDFKESIKTAGESMEKILCLLDDISGEESKDEGSKDEGSKNEGSKDNGWQTKLSPKDSQLYVQRNLRKKINTYNEVLEESPEMIGDTCSLFRNCFSSPRSSLQHIPAPKGNGETRNVPAKNSGGEGDICTQVKKKSIKETELEASQSLESK